MMYSAALFSLAALLLACVLPKSRAAIFSVLVIFLVCTIAHDAVSLPPPNPPDVVTYVYWLAVYLKGFCIIKLVSITIFGLLLPMLRFEAPRILQDVIEAGAYIAWAIIWMKANGLDATGLITTSAILTALIGLSFQDTLGNIISGLAIRFDHTINEGDWIRVEGNEGKVTEIRWRYTAIETRSWETVIFPNSVIAKNRLTLLGKRRNAPEYLRRSLWFNVDFSFRASQVIEAVNRALLASTIPNVASQPHPVCMLNELGPSYSRFLVWYWLTDIAADLPTDSAVLERIQGALLRSGIPLSIPSQQVRLSRAAADSVGTHAGSQTEKVQLLNRTRLFKSFQEHELHQLAQQLESVPFLSGDVIARQGEEADFLYIIVNGTAAVRVRDERGDEQEVARFGTGDFFGEMALMTGEPRSASVYAESNLTCLRLGHKAFRDILASRPELARELSVVLAQRESELNDVLDDMEDSKKLAHATQERDILRRIKEFFRLN